MKVLITGAAGFIGRALTEALINSGGLINRVGLSEHIDEVLLVDRNDYAYRHVAALHMRSIPGDLADPQFVNHLASLRADSIFHLAASLTAEAEQDGSSSYQTNVESMRLLMENLDNGPKLVFASSIAVFGGILPETVGDAQRAAPETTYGAHKAIAELLLADASRRNIVDGRALRLPIVIIRKGLSTSSVSDRIAAITREPLAGREYECGLDIDTCVPVVSAKAAARAMIALHNVAANDLPQSRAMNLPALTVSVREMVSAVKHVKMSFPSILGGAVTFKRDEALQRIVDSWPTIFVSEVATRLGIRPDLSFAEILAAHFMEAK
jgi:nucleoside-diphosphate-sugar epimerase